MFMNLDLLSAPSSKHQTFPQGAIMLVFPIKEGEHRCIMLKQPPYGFDGKNAHQMKTLWSMVLLGPTFYC
jgi:hypothetical protein